MSTANRSRAGSTRTWRVSASILADLFLFLSNSPIPRTIRLNLSRFGFQAFIAARRIGPVKEVEQSGKNHKHNQTGLGPSRTAGEPIRPVEANIEQMPRDRFAFV